MHFIKVQLISSINQSSPIIIQLKKNPFYLFFCCDYTEQNQNKMKLKTKIVKIKELKKIMIHFIQVQFCF